MRSSDIAGTAREMAVGSFGVVGIQDFKPPY
jgi:hypothetical protein